MPSAPLNALSDASKPGGRYLFIDSIRGFAALFVLFQHAAPAFSAHSPRAESTLIHFLVVDVDLGRVAVAVFFMVSGYVVPFSLKGRRGEGLEHFVISRFFRLYPMYWFSLAFALAISFWLAPPAIPWKLIAINATMMQQFVAKPNVLGVYWTLQIELIFYALCALLFALGLLHRRRSLIVAAATSIAVSVLMAVARYETVRKLPVALPIALSLMFIGTLWKRYQLDNDRPAGRAVAILTGVFVVLLPAISLLAYNRDTGFDEHWFHYTNAYSLALILFFSMTTFGRLHARWATWLGAVSYGVYLLHEPVLVIYRTILFPHLPALPALVHTLFVSAFTLAICGRLHWFLEQPCLSAGKFLSNQLRLRRLAAGGLISPADPPLL